MDIDYKKMAEWNVKRKKDVSREVIYYEYATLICALYAMKWTHRDILGFLHSEVKELAELLPSRKVTNKTLTVYRAGWVKADMVDIDAVNLEIARLKEAFGEVPANKMPVKRGSSVDVFGVTYTKIDFLKSLNKLGIVVDLERPAITTFYDDFAQKYTLDELTNQYIKEKTNSMAG